jgi:hypothetical protein
LVRVLGMFKAGDQHYVVYLSPFTPRHTTVGYYLTVTVDVYVLVSHHLTLCVVYIAH